jgi:hypothetical protein
MEDALSAEENRSQLECQFSETQQFRDKEVLVVAVVVLIQPFGVLIALGDYFIKKEKMKLW